MDGNSRRADGGGDAEAPTQPSESAQAGGPPAAGRASGTLGRLGYLASLAAVALVVTIAVVAGRGAGEQPAPEARLGRQPDLVELIRAEQARVNLLAERAEELDARIAALGEDLRDDAASLDHLSRRVERLAPAAGMTPVVGPGAVVVLEDSSLDEPASGDLNDLIIHEEDLRGVVNALWAGGAEALSINGERVLATSSIRCVGNTLLLHGHVYSPPYKVAAVGPPEELQAALADDPAVERFREAVAEFELGLEVSTHDELRVPGFDSVSSLKVARPAGLDR